MPLDRRNVNSVLVQKGFFEESGDHNYFAYRTTQGKKTTIFTKTSHGSGHKQISDDLVGKMAKQCKLTGKQFRELIACTLSREGYESLLVAAGHVTLKESPEGNS
jgi:hypothetical protein